MQLLMNEKFLIHIGNNNAKIRPKHASDQQEITRARHLHTLPACPATFARKNTGQHGAPLQEK